MRNSKLHLLVSGLGPGGGGGLGLQKLTSKLSCTRLRVPPVAGTTCRATRVAADFLDFIAFCRCSTGVALHPLKILVSHLPPPRAGRCRAEIWGSEKVSRYTGVSQLQLRVSRYTVQLSFETLHLQFLGRKATETAEIAPECQSDPPECQSDPPPPPPRSPILDFLGPFRGEKGRLGLQIAKLDFTKSIFDFWGSETGGLGLLRLLGSQ